VCYHLIDIYCVPCISSQINSLDMPAHQQKSINSFSHAGLLAAGPQRNDFLVAAKKQVNSMQGSESQVKTAQSKDMSRANPVAAEQLEHRHNVFTHSILREDWLRLAPPGKAMPLLTESTSDTNTATANARKQMLASATALQQALMQLAAAQRRVKL
jgi:hypothetical protein